MSRSADAERVELGRAQVQTDSLTITLDFQRLQPRVAEALCRVLGLPANQHGTSMPPQALETFQTAAHAEFGRLSHRNPLDALEFATVLSALLHECRHVHDMRATRCGAELLLHDLQVYAGVSNLLDVVAEWHRREKGRSVPLPVTAGLDWFNGEDDGIRVRITSAERARTHVEGWWKTPSRGPALPGHSIHSLYEALGFSVQIEWLASTFGGDIADRVVNAMPDGVAAETYMRPAILLANFMAARGAKLDPEPHDLSWLLVNALSVSGLDEAFLDGKPTDLHPGTWFQKFAQHYAVLSTKKDLAPVLVAPHAVNAAIKHAGFSGMHARYDKANTAIQNLQDATLHSFAKDGLSGLRRHSESILIATEVAIDFRDMQRVLAARPEYHLPLGYIGLLMSGDLTTVHVRVNNPDRTLGDFRMPSQTPSNHVGGARIASEASQQMRFLLRGRKMQGTFFEEAVYRRLKSPPPIGWGLTFRNAE